MPSIEVSLYECGNARVSRDGEKIYCSKGHILDTRTKDGKVNIQRMARGGRLIFKSCKGCGDLDYMGKPIPKEERGWIERRVYGNSRPEPRSKKGKDIKGHGGD